MASSSDLATKDVAHKVRFEVGSRLEWYERVLTNALRFFALVSGAGLVTTIVFTGFLIQFQRTVLLAVWPAVLFAAALAAIAVFHIGHVLVIRAWASGRLRIRRFEEDDFAFVDDVNIVRRLFSHMQLWPVLVSGILTLWGVTAGLWAVYGG